MQKLTRPAIERILTITAALGSNRGVNTVELAKQFEVSTKTIHRDWDFIRDRMMIEVDLERPGFRYRARNKSQAEGIANVLGAMIGRGVL
jgi:predicted DNA-binding transcriptional regulator YafY